MKHFSLIISCIAVVLTTIDCTVEGNWKYGEEENWPGVCTTGERQSPINVVPSSTTLAKDWKDFELKSFDKLLTGRELKHTGKTVLLDLAGAGLEVKNGDLNGTYEVLQLHFHWAKKVSDSGAEHQIDNKTFPLEVHIVTKNANQPTSTQLAVLGSVFKITSNDNPDLSNLTNFLPNITKAEGEKIKIDIQISKFMPSNMNVFYRYLGSLTTPDCDEHVVWSLFETPIEISQAQLDLFQNIHFSHGDANYRSIQKLNNRVVSKYDRNDRGNSNQSTPSPSSANTTLPASSANSLLCNNIFLLMGFSFWLVNNFLTK